MNTAFIIKNNEIIAYVETDLKNGELVHYGYLSSKEYIDRNRERQLVNAKIGKISRAKKYFKKASVEVVDTALRVNLNSGGVAEFLI